MCIDYTLGTLEHKKKQPKRNNKLKNSNRFRKNHQTIQKRLQLMHRYQSVCNGWQMVNGNSQPNLSIVEQFICFDNGNWIVWLVLLARCFFFLVSNSQIMHSKYDDEDSKGLFKFTYIQSAKWQSACKIHALYVTVFSQLNRAQ